MKILRFAVLFALAASLRAQDIERTVDLPSAKYQNILIEADSGSVALRASNAPQLRGELRYSPPVGMQPEEIALLATVEGSTLIIRGPRTGASGIPIHLTLNVPRGISVSVMGHALSVKAEGFESPLMIRVLSGKVEILDSTGPTSVSTDSGDIALTLRVQPKGDLYLHTDAGTIKCALDSGLSLRALLRSGSLLSWGAGVETLRGSLDRTLGSGGPLLYASSGANKVAVDLMPSELASAGMAVFRAEANWVYMNVIVRDQLEQTIPELRRESFNIFDNGVPVDVGHFESTTEPFQLLLLFDVSGSIKPHVTIIREAARQFIRRAHNGNEFAVATFSSTSRLVQPFTADLDLAEKALNAITPSGGTAIYDAVLTSITEYLKETTGRKAIVLFTDGVDNNLWGGKFGSTHSFKDLLTSVKATDCLIYPIFVQPVPESRYQVTPSPNARPTSIAEMLANAQEKKPELYCGSETNPGATPVPCPRDPYQIIATAENNLIDLAEQTGGRIYTLRRMEDLSSAYRQISTDLDAVYTLGFPVKFTEPNQWHELSVRIRDHPLAIVRTRHGYYSPDKKE
ncbi:MAG: VWA domain-containing protein [Terriglobia bacterium]